VDFAGVFWLLARVVFAPQVYTHTVVYAGFAVLGAGMHLGPPDYSTFRRLGAQLFMRVSVVFGGSCSA
jgi:hypothetical protein